MQRLPSASRTALRQSLICFIDDMPEIDPDNLQYQCCFCGDGITKAGEGGDPLDPCAVVLIARWQRPEEQGVQQFFCNVACFERVSEHASVAREVLEQGGE